MSISKNEDVGGGRSSQEGAETSHCSGWASGAEMKDDCRNEPTRIVGGGGEM